MISERQNKIVRMLVMEYIKTAQPVSSSFLAENYDFGICPSAMRIELQSLIKEGFLEQPHTSAGRIPTDKAYRLFVNGLKGSQSKKGDKIEDALEGILKKKESDEVKTASALAKFLADISSGLIMLHLYDEGITLKEGLEDVFSEPESEDREFVSGFINFIENFERHIDKINVQAGIRIMIGEEIPVPKAKNMTMICSECNFPSQRAFISILGPKRMDYDKNISIINSLNKALEEIL
jgi:transcriptional regulator of heat shock response